MCRSGHLYDSEWLVLLWFRICVEFCREPSIMLFAAFFVTFNMFSSCPVV